MNEAALRKRKIVEISLPSFSWKLLWSPKVILSFFVLGLAMAFAYWALAVRPYLWISSGRVDAASLQMRANEEGMLSQLAVQDGDRVEKGQLLFSFESDQIVKREKQIEASLASLREQRNFYARQSEKAMQDYLADLGVAPQEEIDQHLQLLQEAQSRGEELLLEAEALEQKSKELKVQLEKYMISAPFDGVVLKQKKMVGDFITAGEPVLSLFDLNRSWVEARVPEKKLHLIQVGQPAKIRLASYPGSEWEGSVSWIGPATLSRLEGTEIRSEEEEIPIKISFPKDNFPLKPGLSAEVGIKVY
jgi:RND family efflux transporter MFP subunit